MEEFAEIWREEHGRAILAALNKVFNDTESEELQIPESIAEESDEMLTEWEDIRDDSELFSLLQESEFEDVDVFMVEVQSIQVTMCFLANKFNCML